MYIALIAISTLAGAISLLAKAYRKSNENVHKMYESQIEYIKELTSQEVKNYQEITDTLKTIAKVLKVIMNNCNATHKEQAHNKDEIEKIIGSCKELCGKFKDLENKDD